MNKRDAIASPTSRASWNPMLAVALAGFILLQSWVMAFLTPRGAPPDELAHISYIRDVADGGVLPDYATGVIGNSPRGNYLNHPPLYYTVLGLYSRLTGLHPFNDYQHLRLLSAVFVALGVLLWLLAGRELGASATGAVLATLAIASVPMFPYLAGSVNNDTLAYLGTGLYFFGLSRWHGSGERDRAATAAIFAGLCITLLTKATASAFVVVFSIAYLVPYATQLPSRLRADRSGAIVLAAALAICASFYLYALLEFGSLMPKPQPLRPSTPPAEPLPVLAYAARYATTMWNRLPVIVSHLSLDPFVPRGHVFFYAMAIAPVLAWAAARATAARNGITATLRHASDAFMFACMGTLALHFLQAYLGYRDTGLFGGLQPRYLFAMLPGLWLMPFVLRPARRLRAVYTATLCISAMFAFWSSVPFFLGKQSDLARASAPALRPPPVHAASSAKLLEGGRGHVDVLRRSGKGLRVRGWAYHPNASTPVSRVLVFAGERMIAALQLRVARPDVARRMGDVATRSGFAADIPIAESSRECEIQIAAQGPDDRVFWIRRASCQP